MGPIVGLLTCDVYVRHSQSLKDKRRVIKSLKDRLRAGFNASVAEVDYQDDRKRAQIAVSVVGSDSAYVAGALDKIRNAIFLDPVAEMGACEIDML